MRDGFVHVAAAGRATRSIGWVATARYRVLRAMLGTYDAAAMVGAHTLGLLDTEGFRTLLGELPANATLLDVGVGSGDVHRALRPLFASAHGTETARRAAQRATESGIHCDPIDLITAPNALRGPYDVVALLNVLDRTAQPRTLLAACVARVARDGKLMLSVPLPVRPHVETPSGTCDPDEWIASRASTWEDAFDELVEDVLEPTGLVLDRWTRAPYTSSGDAWSPPVVYDAAIVTAKLRTT